MITKTEFLNKVKEFEGLRLNSYRCPAGVWTIGYGHTSHVTANMCITKCQADELLLSDLTSVFLQLKSCCKSFDTWHRGLRFALIDFVFNVGISSFKRSSLYKKVLNYGNAPFPNLKLAEFQFLRWVYSNGKELRGLRLRREFEVSLFS